MGKNHLWKLIKDYYKGWIVLNCPLPYLMTESTFLIFSQPKVISISQSVNQSINQSGITPSYISYSYIGIFAVLLNELHKPWHPCHPATLFGSGGGRNHGDPGHERPHGPLAAAVGGEWRHQHGGAGTSPGHEKMGWTFSVCNVNPGLMSTMV